MARKILAFFVGLVTFLILYTVVSGVSIAIHGTPDMEKLNDPQYMAQYISTLPTTAFIMLAAAYMLGSLGAGFVMQKISRWDSLILPLTVGVIGTVLWAYNAFAYPHPVWMTVLGFFCFIPFTIAGHRMAKL